jgi:glutamate transport system permease protein
MSAVLYDVPGPRARRRALVGGVVGTAAVAVVIGLVVWKLAAAGQFDGAKWRPFTDPAVVHRLLVDGLVSTVRAAVYAVALALVFGVVFAAARLSDHRWVRVPATVVIEFFRATPVLLLILFAFFTLSSRFDRLGAELSRPLPADVAHLIGLDQANRLGPLVVALMLYNGSVLAEIFRAGILAVPRGQSEAAYALGLRKSGVMRLVLVPQAARIMLPAIISQCVVALKDTALGAVTIAYEELVRVGQLLYNGFFNIIPTALVLACLFIAMNMSLSRFAVWLEGREARRYGREAVEAVESAVDVH